MTPARLDHKDDQRLNAAITAASINDSFESYLDILDAFYSEDVQVILGEGTEPVCSRDDLRSRLSEFLAPIHINGGSRWFVSNSSIDSSTCARRSRHRQQVGG